MTIRFGVPAADRLAAWGYLLDLHAVAREADDFVSDQRRQQFTDLQRAVLFISPHLSELLPGGELLPDAEPALETTPMIHAMHLMREQAPRMRCPDSEARAAEEALCRVFGEFSGATNHDWFWLFSSFSGIQMQRGTEWFTYQRILDLVLSENKRLHSHLLALNDDQRVAVEVAWFGQVFVNTLPRDCLLRIYDRIIGGTSVLGCFAGLSLVLALKQEIGEIGDPAELAEFICRPPASSVTQHIEAIINVMMVLWNKHGSPTVD